MIYSSIEQQLFTLLNQGLYDSADILAQSVLKNELENISFLQLYSQILYKKKEYLRSVKYNQLLLNYLEKSNMNSSSDKIKTLNLISQCYFKLGETKLAVKTLLLIPKDKRTIKILLTLANVYRQQNQFTHAKKLYIEILQKNPLATEALIAISEINIDNTNNIKLIDIRKIHSQLQNKSEIKENTKSIDLMSNAREIQSLQENLLKAHIPTTITTSSSTKITDSIQYLSNIREVYPYFLHSLEQIAISYTRNENIEKAKYVFESLRTIENYYIRSMDVYGSILKNEGNIMGLNKLAHDLLNIDKYAPESWIVMAQYCDVKNLKNDAVIFVEKAVNLSDGKQINAFSYIIRGELQLSLKRPLQSVQSYMLAYTSQKDFIVYKGLVHGYLELRKFDEALRFAKEAWAKIHDAKSLTLLGNVLMSAPYDDGRIKARKFLEKALKLDPFCFEAVMALVELNISEKKLKEAIELLNKQKEREQKKPEYIQTKLGDIAVMSNSPAEAMMYYHTALQINSHFQPALDGLEQLEKQLHRLKADSEEEDEELTDSGSELGDSFDLFT